MNCPNCYSSNIDTYAGIDLYRCRKCGYSSDNEDEFQITGGCE